MRKLSVAIGFTALGVLGSAETFAQCTVEAFPADTIVITCGEEREIQLSAFGISGNFAINNDFNDGTLGTGWQGTLSATYNNPCGNGPDGTIHVWMGDATPQPRTLTTQSFDLSTGGTICYEMRYSVQADPAPCEGPDEPAEGVYLQYSVNNGPWVTIDYLDPIGGYDPIITSWQQYCHSVPVAAQTANTRIRWHQDATSGAEYDHWGLDNVFISINDPNYTFEWSHGETGSEPPVVAVSTDSVFTVSYSDGTDTCTDTVVIQTVPPVFTVSSVADTSICGDGCINLDAIAEVLVRPASTPTFENNEFQPLVPLGQATVISLAVGGMPVNPVEAGTIESVCINVNNPALPFPINMGTFTITLQCPEGASVTLVSPGDLSGTSLSNMCFSDAGAPLSTGSSPFSGLFQPSSGSMDDLIDCSTDGVWNITITNSDFLAFGFFNSWDITFNVPEISYTGEFEWSPTTGLDNPQSLNPQACPGTSTTYELMVTDSFDCATTTHEVTIGIIDPNELSIEASVTDANCEAADGAVEVTVIGASGNEVITWDGGTTGNTITGVAPGDIALTVEDGCVLDTTVTVGSQPSQLSLEAVITPTPCGTEEGAIDVTVFGASGNETVSWDNGEDGVSITELAAGQYQVTVSDGCILDSVLTVGTTGGPQIDSVLLEGPQPEMLDGELTIIVVGGTEPIEFSMDGMSFQLDSVFTGLEAGTYLVTVQDDFGCQDTLTVVLEIAEVEIPSVFSPTSEIDDNRTFVIKGMTSPEVQIYSRWGRKVYESGNYQNDWDGEEYSEGVYFYTIKNKADGQAYTGYVHIVK